MSNNTTSQRTDAYFKRTRDIVKSRGDCEVTYALFMRRPVISAPRLALDALREHVQAQGAKVSINQRFEEGELVGAGEVIFSYTSSFSALVEIETRLLQLLGPACVAAYNAYVSVAELPKVAFIAMDGRHCAGNEMMDIMAYGASVGSGKAKKELGAIGFIGTSNDALAHIFDRKNGLGTMPHALVGYAGSTLEAAALYHKQFPDQPMTVLVDYFGREISDSLAVAKAFPELADNGKLSLRMDTSSARFIEGLDPGESYKILDRFSPKSIRGYRSEQELKHMVGSGVSAAAVWELRSKLNANGFEKVKIVASSGFTPEKCRVFGFTDAPVDVIGTGSYLPSNWLETYATADIIAYDGSPRVKVGREFLQVQCGIIEDN